MRLHESIPFRAGSPTKMGRMDVASRDRPSNL